MGWFGPKLQPGEQILLRLPARARMDWHGFLQWLAVPTFVIAATYVTGIVDLNSLRFWHYIAALTVVPALVTVLQAIGIFVWNRYWWRIVVTDQRVLAVTRRLPRRHVVLDRNAITAFARDTVNQSLVFDLHGRQVIVRFPNHWEEEKVLEAIGREAGSIA
jgi:hypothetical protein